MRSAPPEIQPYVEPDQRRRLQQGAKLKLGLALAGTAVLGIQVFVLGHDDDPTMLILMWLLYIPWMWGCADYARSKGYSWLLGIAGYLWFIGPMILFVIPNRWPKVPPGTGSVYPRKL